GAGRGGGGVGPVVAVELAAEGAWVVVVVVADVAEREAAAALGADDLREAGGEGDLTVVEERAAVAAARDRCGGRWRAAQRGFDLLDQRGVDEFGLDVLLERLDLLGRALSVVVVVRELELGLAAARLVPLEAAAALRRRGRTGSVALAV